MVGDNEGVEKGELDVGEGGGGEGVGKDAV